MDYYSNFWEIDLLPYTEPITVVRKLKAHFARYGIPDILMSGNRPQYATQTFKRLAESYEFPHITSSPGYSQSNGKAESAVKKLLKTFLEELIWLNLTFFLLYLTIAIHQNESGYSPAQCLMSRRTKTLMPTPSNLLKPEVSIG